MQESEGEMGGVIEIVRDRTKRVLAQVVRGEDDSHQVFLCGRQFLGSHTPADYAGDSVIVGRAQGA